jgi:DNA-binding transcriptional MerR regulator
VDPTSTHDDPGDDPDGGSTAALLTLEELSDRSGVPPRTIRYYQGEKLLDRPERDRKDGRVARYGTQHVEQLRLIGELRDRGLKLPAIRTLLHERDASTRVADWLGLDDTLRGSWGQDAPRLMSRAELAEVTEPTPPGTQGLLEDAGLLVRQGDAVARAGTGSARAHRAADRRRGRHRPGAPGRTDPPAAPRQGGGRADRSVRRRDPRRLRTRGASPTPWSTPCARPRATRHE